MMPEFHSPEIPFALHPLGMLQILLDRGHTLEALLSNSGIVPADLAKKHFAISFAQILQIVDNAQPGPVSNIIYASPNLAEAYFSFRSLQYALRAERARCHLRYSRLPQDDLAQVLGFSCASSMRRAARLSETHSVTAR